MLSPPITSHTTAADQGYRAVAEVSPENSDSPATGVTGWGGPPGEFWGPMVPGRFGQRQGIHRLAMHEFASLLISSLPSSRPHSGLSARRWPWAKHAVPWWHEQSGRLSVQPGVQSAGRARSPSPTPPTVASRT